MLAGALWAAADRVRAWRCARRGGNGGAGPQRHEDVIERSEEVRVRAQVIEITAEAQMAGREGELGREHTALEGDGGVEVRGEDQVRVRSRAGHGAEAPVGGDQVMDVDHSVVAPDALFDHEPAGRIARCHRSVPGRRRRDGLERPQRGIELGDPGRGEELGHGRGSYRWVRWGRARSRAYARRVPASARRATGVPASLADVGRRAEARIVELLDAEIARWEEVDPDLGEPLRSLRALVLAGGKRLRPAFCHWAFVGAGGVPHAPEAVDAGAALELLHTFALIHDDVMDGSDRRRGLASVHTHFIELHEARDWRGEARRFGEGAAILVGDLAFVYADILFGLAGPEPRRIFDELRVELCIGQYLDLVGTASASNDPAQAARIERYKSGKYTVERPLHVGAALAGRLDELGPALSAVGLPLGEAFQLRDDLLGVFGDASVTGKPVGDDLREGKLTPLVAVAASRVDRAGADVLGRLGTPDLGADEIRAIQEIIVATGARDEIEATIEQRVDEALAALAATPITSEARASLEELGTYVAWRDH